MNHQPDTVESVFASALEEPSSEKRAAYLDRVCAGNPALRDRVEALLKAHEGAGNFLLDQPAWPRATADAVADADLGLIDCLPVAEGVSERPGTRIGRYKLLQQIGDGGMGTVYMAEQEQPVRRKVALKIIKPGMDSAQVIARFEAERQALALMDHLNIAKVHDAGTTDTGRPYFVMELIHGAPITTYCDRNKLTPRQRLELFVPVCQGIQHAHQKGIIHRDIKPSNVLVTLYDGKPVPKLIDFGVAKATEQRLTERTLFTRYGTIVGTFEYMSPEQAEMSALGVDTRSDIYSLGVLLYELLTGTTPLGQKQLEEAGYLEAVRLIKEEEPTRPSLRLSTSAATLASISQERGTEPAMLTRLVKGELDWIVLKCLEKDRTRRYETANALARDIQRYLADETVEACPPSAAYRLRKFARKYKKALATTAAFIALLVLGAAMATWQAVRATLAEAEATAQRDLAAGAEQEANRQRDAAALAEIEARAQRDEARATSAKLQLAQQELRATLYATHLNLARAAWEANNIGRLRELLELTRPRPGERDLRDFEWHYWNRQCHTELLTVQTENASGRTLALSPDARRFATTETTRPGDVEGSSVLRIRDAASGKVLVTINMTAWGYIPGDRAWSRDGRRLLGLVYGRNLEPPGPELKVWDTVTAKELLSIRELGSWAHGAAFSPDGRFVTASFAASGPPREQPARAKVWDAATGKELLTIEGTTNLAFSPDGKHLAAPIPLPVPEGEKAIGGTRPLASAGARPRQTQITFWDITTGKKLLSFPPSAGWIGRLVFSPDGRRLAGELDRSVQVWDARLDATPVGKELFNCPGLHGVSEGPKFSPDGKRLAAVAMAGGGAGGGMPSQVLRILDAATGKRVCSLPPGTFTRELAFSPDGTRLATGGDDSTVKIWDIEARRPQDTDSRLLLTLKGHTGLVARVAWGSDGTRLFSSGMDGTVKVWDARAHPAAMILKGTNRPVSTAFSPEAGRFAVSSYNASTRAHEVTVWDLSRSERPQSISFKPPTDSKGQDDGAPRLNFSRDGTRLLGTFLKGKRALVRVWEAATGHELSTADVKHGGDAHTIAISPGGQRLAWVVRTGKTTYGPSELRIWDVAASKQALSIKESNGYLRGVTFGPDGARVAAFVAEPGGQKIKVWDAHSGEVVFASQLTRRFPSGELVFSPDATRIAASTGFWDGPAEVTLWDAATGKRVATLKGHSGNILSLAFSPDGRRIASVAVPGGSWGLPGEVKLWDAATGRELLMFQGLAVSQNQHLAFSTDGTRLYQAGSRPGSVGDIEVKVWGATPLPEEKAIVPQGQAAAP